MRKPVSKRRRLFARCLLILFLAAPGWVGRAAADPPIQVAQLIENQSLKQDFIVNPTSPAERDSAGGSAAAPVDPSGIWYHLKRQDRQAARAELGRLQQENPGWTPPAALLRALAIADIRAAARVGQAAATRRLLADLGPVDYCAEPDIGWSAAKAAGGKEILFQMIRNCRDPKIRRISLDWLLGRHPSPRLLDRLAKLPLSAAAKKRLEDARGQFVANLGKAATPRQLEAIKSRIEARRDAAAAVQLGWQALRDGKPEPARQLFAQSLAWSEGKLGGDGMGWALLTLGDPEGAEAYADRDPALKPSLEQAYEAAGWAAQDAGRPDRALAMFAKAGGGEGPRYGTVLALRKSGQDQEAEDLACADRALSDRLTQACGDGLAEAQLAAYRAGRYQESLDDAARLAAIQPGRSDCAAITAWARYRLDQYDQAALLFGRLYDARPDRDLAEGLVASLRAAGEEEEIAARIAAGDALIGEIERRRLLATAYDRKQFDLASAGDAKPGLAGRDGIAVDAGIEMSHAQGGSGLGRFDIIGLHSGVQLEKGGMRLSARVVEAVVSSGNPGPMADFGGPLPDSYPTQTRFTVQVPDVAFHYEMPSWTVEAHLGTTPIGGPVAARLTESLAVTGFGENYGWTARLFSQGVDDSLLSFAGMRDPASGKSWGRVVEEGAAIEGNWAPAKGVSLAVGGLAAHFDGVGVADNSRFDLRVDAAYDPRPDGFDHLRAGPFLSLSHFERNLGHFTLGQGGYYSPDKDARVGVLLDFLTAEGRRWQFESKFSAAFGLVDEAASRRFPLAAASSANFAGSKSEGYSTDFNLRASRLLDEHMILSGFGHYATAIGYRDVTLGLMLTIPFESRGGLVSGDLPNRLLQLFR